MGIWLTIAESSGVLTEDHRSKIVAAISRSFGAAAEHSVLCGTNVFWMLVALEADESEQLKEQVVGGRLREFGVTGARVVDLNECDQDAEYIQRILAKDETALAEMLSRFGAQVEQSLIRRFRDVLDASEVAEAINVAAANVWRSASRFNPGLGNLATWFYRTAERVAIDCIRVYRRHDAPLEYEPADIVRKAWASTTVHANAQLIADLNEIIDELPGLQKSIILADLAAGERADDERLAKRFETTVNVVRVSRHKARKKIHDHMIELGHRLEDPEKP